MESKRHTIYNRPYTTDFPLERSKMVIIDTDPGCDDVHALLLSGFLSLKHDIKILGVTCIFGNTSIDHTVKNAAVALDQAGLKDTKIYIGENKNIMKTDNYGDNFFKPDGLGGCSDKYYQDLDLSRVQKSKHASDFIIETLHKYPGQVDIWTFGPLTNIATAILRDAEVPKLVQNVITCGTSYLGVGLTIENLVSEFNVYSDVEAAAIVANHLARWVIIPFETILEIPSDQETEQRIFEPDTEKGRFLKDIFGYTYSITHRYFFADPVVPLTAVHPELVTEWYYNHCEIQTNTGSRGRLQVDWLNQSNKTPNCIIVQQFNFTELINISEAALQD